MPKRKMLFRPLYERYGPVLMVQALRAAFSVGFLSVEILNASNKSIK